MEIMWGISYCYKLHWKQFASHGSEPTLNCWSSMPIIFIIILSTGDSAICPIGVPNLKIVF